MGLVTKPATPGLWFDTSTKLTATSAGALRRAGYLGVFRYLPLPSNAIGADLDAPEARIIAAAGLEQSAVQHVRFPGWDPAKQSGTVDAGIAAFYASAAGHKGNHLWLDLEGVSTTASPGAVKIYAEAWAAGVIAQGFQAGVYVGYDVPLTALEWYDLHGIDCYWSDFGPRSVATRGFAVVQRNPNKLVAGVKIDEDLVGPDKLGDLPSVMTSGPSSSVLIATP